MKNRKLILISLSILIGIAVFGLFCQIQAATQNWPFTTASDYTYDDSKIEISSDQAQLKSPSNWYNTSWTRREPITITGSTAGAQTNYQVKITVSYDSDMQADFEDIRFTDSDGTTLIDYWLESKTDSSTADFWVEAPNIPVSPNTVTIYMYYGNSSASSASNGNNTFVLFDSFDTLKTTVLPKGSSGTWDDYRVVWGSIGKEDSTYYMYYAGNDGSKYRIGLATSTDLESWTKDSGNPILDQSQAWEGTHISGPELLTDLEGNLIKYDDKYWLAYISDANKKIGIAYAASITGPWTKLDTNPRLEPSA